MFGGFQVGAFQPLPAFQQEGEVLAPVGGGGFWQAYDHHAARRLRRKRELEEAQAEAQALQALDAEIAQLLLEQEQVSLEQEEFQRLQALAETYAGKASEATERVQAALLAAREKKTQGALEALQREISRMQEEEEMALLLLLNQDD